MIRIVKYVFLVVLLVFTGIYLAVDYRTVGYLWYSTGSTYFPLILTFFFLYVVFLRKRLSFVENLQHEGTHLLFAVLTFRKVSGFYVSTANGSVDTKGNQKSGLISLSPYFFPLLPMMLIVLFSFVDFKYCRHLVIVSFFWYLAVLFKNFSKGRKEFFSFGFIGVISIIVMNFWISQFILSWCMPFNFNLSTILKSISDGIS